MIYEVPIKTCHITTYAVWLCSCHQHTTEFKSTCSLEGMLSGTVNIVNNGRKFL